MKKIMLSVLFICMVCVNMLPQSMASSAASYIDLSQQDQGIVTIDKRQKEPSKLKVRISKDDTYYTYDVTTYNHYPLQMGVGTYIVMVLEQVSGTTYKLIEQQNIDYKGNQPEAVYLQSVQNIQWDETKNFAEKAAELTEKATSDAEKVSAIYQYIINNITYDTIKASQLQPGYLPSNEQTFEQGTGICYDYSSLFAAMLRSIDIPAKLVMGHKDDIEVYHAWNEVFLSETGQWVTIDTTYDAALNQHNKQTSMIKDRGSYTTEKQY